MNQVTVPLPRDKFSSKKGKGLRFFLFGALAIAFHLSLLLIPLRHASPPETPSILQLEIVEMPRTAPQEQQAKSVSEPTEISHQTLQIPEIARTAAISNEPTKEISAVVRQVITSSEIFEQVEQLNLPEPAATVLSLGVASHKPLPANLSEPVLAYIPTVFDRYYAPLETEILDNWQQADGTRMMVMRTTSGHTLCGRIAPWDPANPLLEPVPLFYSCAGGGRRKH